MKSEYAYNIKGNFHSNGVLASIFHFGQVILENLQITPHLEKSHLIFVENGNKTLIFPLLAALALPIAVNAEPALRYKVTCDDYPCTENEQKALRLVNENYGKKLENRLKNNTYYPHPWYWVYKEKSNCEYTVAVREDMPTHMATMEWVDVDICKKTTKLRTY